MHNLMTILNSLSPTTIEELYDMSEETMRTRFNLSQEEANALYRVMKIIHELELLTRR